MEEIMAFLRPVCGSLSATCSHPPPLRASSSSSSTSNLLKSDQLPTTHRLPSKLNRHPSECGYLGAKGTYRA